VSPESLWVLCLLLFADGATFSFATTPLLLEYGKYHAPWQVALAGSVASAAGNIFQLALLRRLLAGDYAWLRRFRPSQDRLDAALASHPSTSFLTILVARATPLPDAPVKIVAAAVRYPLPLYFLAVLLGAVPYYYVLSLIGHEVRIPTWVILGAVGLIALGLVVDRLRRHAKDRG
jgi:uncharacterized membrane protein YdjX (TVP38/TMEM64 family)